MANLTQNPSNTGQGSLVQYVTWNCKGLNGAVKRGNIMAHLKKLGGDIIFLQETHLKNKDQNRLRCKWVGQIFHSNFNVNSRGTAILIRKGISFSPTKIISDSYGRYIIVTGQLYNIPVVLVNVYAPNFDDERFFTSLLNTIPDLDTHQLIMAGDFNLVLCPALDRSSNKPAPLSKSARIIHSFMNIYKVVDPWRFFFPNQRKYSFFSPVHHSYSRIDFFLIDSRLISTVKYCDYEAVVLSDHGPVILQLTLTKKPVPKIWRFDNGLLSDKAFVEQIKTHINVYLSINDNSDTSRSTLWEALKAYIRGQIISYSSLIKKQNSKQKDELTDQLLEIDRQYSISPSPDLYKRRITLQTEFKLLCTTETAKLLTRARHKSYEHGERAGKLLAHQIKEVAASRLITKIRTGSGQITVDPEEINNTFKNYYIKLYTSDSPRDPSLLDNFFDGLDIPSITSEQRDSLEDPVTKEEIIQVINNLQCSKAPGPDGYTSEFYKTFKDQISPLLLDLIIESNKKGSLPPTFYQANISLLHKENKDPLDPGSYRPLSLLNVDNKIFAKVLATRLEEILPTVISPDQTGFIKNRQLFFNIRRLLNIIYTPSSDDSEILISLDAEKAFDRVEWDYLLCALSRFGFGTKFVSLIKLLYACPQASVQTNDNRSDYFTLSRSCRQGCPLSPLLFALAIEPLAISLRTEKLYSGIYRAGGEHKVSLYADDLLLFISNPIKSLPIIMSTLEKFGAISGYKLNLSKSILFKISPKMRQQTYSPFPFTISEQFRYLGVTITKTFDELFKQNFLKLYDRTALDFERWTKLPLSLAGRINTVKMNTLPKFLFLFQCIPFFINKAFFKKLDKIIASFIWNKKTPRIKASFLQRSKTQGGMGLPHFQLYYWSCNIRALSFWFQDQLSDWASVESHYCYPSSLAALLYSALPIPRTHFLRDPVILHSVKIWTQIRRHFGWQAGSALAPLAANHSFIPSLSDSGFHVWYKKGILSIKDLFTDKVFATFQQLQEKFALPQSHFFKYLQIRSFVKDKFPSFPNEPISSPMDSLLLANPFIKGGTSIIYSQLSELEQNTTLQYLKLAWEKDLGIELSDEHWTEAQERVHSCSVCARHGLLQFKILHRLHFSKLKLSKMYKNVDPTCNRCGQEPASLAHMFWKCPNITSYWVKVFQSLSDIINKPLDPDPASALLGIHITDPSLSNNQHRIITFVTLLARRLILLNWKQQKPPTLSTLMKEIMEHLQLEKLRFLLKGKTSKFYKIWQPFLEYFKNFQLNLS